MSTRSIEALTQAQAKRTATTSFGEPAKDALIHSTLGVQNADLYAHNQGLSRLARWRAKVAGQENGMKTK